MQADRRVWFAVLVLVLAGRSAFAATPWQKMLPFKRVEADARKDYALTEQNGPWMIMAATFRGAAAEKQAHELVLELREHFKLPAYTHKKVYDFTETLIGRGVNPDGTPKRMKYMQDETVEEVAVLVGDYASVDDADAQKTLKKLKYAQPESLALERGRGSSQAFGTLRRTERSWMRNDDEDKQKGPMGHAFVTTNPLLPKEYFAPRGIDKLELDMNADVEHSLLDCPGRYTVRIATFTGRKSFGTLEHLEARGLLDKPEEDGPLARAASKAHRLTAHLRAQGIDAYEFHDRSTSIVTVGSFDLVGTPRQDGKTEINPQIHAIMKYFGGQPDPQAVQLTSGGTAAGLKGQIIAGVSLDIQPMPVEVPRRSISADYRRESYR